MSRTILNPWKIEVLNQVKTEITLNIVNEFSGEIRQVKLTPEIISDLAGALSADMVDEVHPECTDVLLWWKLDANNRIVNRFVGTASEAETHSIDYTHVSTPIEPERYGVYDEEGNRVMQEVKHG